MHSKAEVVKLVDTLASGASARKGVEVQVLSSAPIKKEGSQAGALFRFSPGLAPLNH